jgi:hypothetical protein
MEPLWNDKETAQYIGGKGKPMQPDTLIAWRNRGVGPKYIKVGRLRRYRQEDVDRWLLAQTVTKQEMERTRQRAVKAEARRQRLRAEKAKAEPEAKPRTRLRSEK